MDAVSDPEKVTALRNLASARGLPFFEISSVTGKGIEPLKFALAERVLPAGNG
jgi:GTP-binding protein